MLNIETEGEEISLLQMILRNNLTLSDYLKVNFPPLNLFRYPWQKNKTIQVRSNFSEKNKDFILQNKPNQIINLEFFKKYMDQEFFRNIKSLNIPENAVIIGQLTYNI